MMSYHLEIEGSQAKQIIDKYGITLSALNIIVFNMYMKLWNYGLMMNT